MFDAQDFFRALIAFIAAIQPVIAYVVRDAFKRVDNLERRLDDCLDFQRGIATEKNKRGN
jgi:hypothetical protein